MDIPWNLLEPDTLNRLLSEIVTRDGTDYGQVEMSLNKKVQDALRLLDLGKAKLVYDEMSETCCLWETK